MECKIVELHSDWLEVNQDSWPCTALLPNRMQSHMKTIELRSDWLTRKHDCWACKNQENAQLSPDPSPRGDLGLGTRLCSKEIIVLPYYIIIHRIWLSTIYIMHVHGVAMFSRSRALIVVIVPYIHVAVTDRKCTLFHFYWIRSPAHSTYRN